MLDVVVVGGGVSGLATAAGLRQLGVAVRLLEGGRPGGTLGTDAAGGFLVERGPHAFVDREPATRGLVAALGLGPRVIAATPAARTRWVFSRGALHALPASAAGLVRWRGMSRAGRLRALAEPFVRRGDPAAEETLAALVERRLGGEALAALVEPAVAGLYAGDAAALSARAALPALARLEEEHGSFFRGALALARARSPGAPLCTLAGGMGELAASAAALLGDHLRPAAAHAIEAAPGGFLVRTDGEALAARAVVLAAPAHAAAGLVGPLDGAAAGALLAIPYAPVAVVGLGYRRDQVAHPLDGYGFLARRGEGLSVLGALFESTLFPGRAPESHVLVRALLGGALDPGRLAEPDEALAGRARADLERVLGAAGPPMHQAVIRWPRGIPQLTVGHLGRVETARRLEARYPGLFLAGAALDGVGVNDCTRGAERLVVRLGAFLGR